MKFFSYITDACLNDAKRHSVASELQRLARKVEEDQCISSWDKFLPSPYIKKSLGRDWRVIAERRLPNEKDVVAICFVALLSRGSREYSNFMDDPNSFGRPLSPAEEDINRFVADRLAGPPPPVLPPPSEPEYAYLYGQLTGPDSSYGMIYESKEWVDLISKAGGKLSWYYELVGEALKLENANRTKLNKQDVQILYRRFQEPDCLFLIAPLANEDDGRRSDLESVYKDVINLDRFSLEADQYVHLDILKRSARAYPAFVMADNNIWGKIQENTEANIALSPEESTILDSVTHYSGAVEKIYPLFINGRPGSGKSTILQYLFAEHLYHHLSRQAEERLANPPLYLTYSEKLLQWARAVVKSLVLCGSKQILQESNPDLRELEASLGKCFAEFHRLLYEKLPEDERQKFYPPKRIDYTDFRRRWHAKIKANPSAELRNLSPELVWHVIRTYIKGMRDDENNYLDLEGYTELPPKQRTVERETYAKIYEKVWDAWYRPLCEDQGYWDDQDLARVLLNKAELRLSNYPVIFCDEAQDFTKVELELILRLSLYSRRLLQREDLKRVPFAFAGDPFQTLNPTGFDWDSVQAGFYEKIVQELDKSSQNNLKFNYQELHYNYRSSKYIVGFCNLIQLLRGILFEVKHLEPQRPWFEDDAPPPAFFDVDSPSTQEKLEEQAEIVIILPCQEGEEQSYIENDALLSSLARNDVRNFLSPMSAKGLEFSRVVLYKFGEDCRRNYANLFDPLQTGEPHSRTPELALPLQYFVNRLYVAASRPKRRLFIVDTKEGIEYFWNSAALQNPGELVKMYPTAEEGGWNSDDLAFIQPGREVDWTEDRDQPEQIAQQFFNEGLATKDPYKLRLAEANFRRVGNAARERDARAKRLEIEGEFIKAAKEYLELGEKETALKLFWKAKAYEDIFNRNTFLSTNEHKASGFVILPKSPASCESFLEFLYNEVTSAGRAKLLADKRWAEVGGILISALAELRPEDMSWASVYSKIELVEREGLEFPRTPQLAEVAFRAGRYSEAVTIWDEEQGIWQKSNSYKRAKASSESYPQNLKLLEELHDFEGIARSYESNAESPIPAEGDIILKAYMELGRDEEALNFATLLLNAKVRAAQWNRAIALVEKESWVDEDKDSLRAVLVNNLSVSDALTDDKGERQNIIADYLKSHLRELSGNPHITLRSLGAAIERAGRIVDALVYYEPVWKRSKEVTPDMLFARERWLKCKYTQADYSEIQGKSGDALRQRREADKMAMQWKINPKNLPLYPHVQVDNELGPLASKEDGISDLSADQLKAIKDLLSINWMPTQIANVLNVPVEVVEMLSSTLITDQHGKDV